MCIIYGNFRSLSFSLSSLGTVSTRHRSLSNSTVGHHRQNSADIRPSLNLINASRNLISRVESSWSENQCIRRERTRKRSNFFQILLGIDYIIIDHYSFIFTISSLIESRFGNDGAVILKRATRTSFDAYINSRLFIQFSIRKMTNATMFFFLLSHVQIIDLN